MSHVDNRETFRTVARDKGLPDETVDWWLQFARPRLALRRAGDGPVAGQFLGRPSLPADTAWPHGLTHCATVDLAAIPPGSHDLDLPPDGRLLFFAEADITPTEAQVIYVPAGTPVVECAQPEDFYVPAFDPAPLHAATEWSIPGERLEIAADLGEPVHDEETIESIMWSFGADEQCEVAIGGYGDQSTGGGDTPVDDPREECVLATVYLRDDVVGESFGGSPLCLITFLMTYEDLAARRFDRVRHASDFNG